MVAELGEFVGFESQFLVAKSVSGNGVHYFNCAECQKFRLSVRSFLALKNKKKAASLLPKTVKRVIRLRHQRTRVLLAHLMLQW